MKRIGGLIFLAIAILILKGVKIESTLEAGIGILVFYLIYIIEFLIWYLVYMKRDIKKYLNPIFYLNFIVLPAWVIILIFDKEPIEKFIEYPVIYYIGFGIGAGILLIVAYIWDKDAKKKEKSKNTEVKEGEQKGGRK